MDPIERTRTAFEIRRATSGYTPDEVAEARLIATALWESGLGNRVHDFFRYWWYHCHDEDVKAQAALMLTELIDKRREMAPPVTAEREEDEYLRRVNS